MLLCVSFSGLLRVLPVKSFRARPRFDHCVLQVWMVLGSLREPGGYAPAGVAFDVPVD